MSAEAATSGCSEGKQEPAIRFANVRDKAVLMREDDCDKGKGAVAFFYKWVAWTAGVNELATQGGQTKMKRIFSDILAKVAVFTPTEWGLSVAGAVPFGFARQGERSIEPSVSLANQRMFEKKLNELACGYEPFSPEDYDALLQEFGRRKTNNGYAFVTDGEKDAVGEEKMSCFVPVPVEQLYLMAIMRHTVNLSCNLAQNASANSGKLVHWQSTAPFFNFVRVMEQYRQRGNLSREESDDFILNSFAESTGTVSRTNDSEIWEIVAGCDDFHPLDYSPVLVDRHWTQTDVLLNLTHDELVQRDYDPVSKAPGSGLFGTPLRVAVRVKMDGALPEHEDTSRDYFECPSYEALLTSVHLTLAEVVYQMFRSALGKSLD